MRYELAKIIRVNQFSTEYAVYFNFRLISNYAFWVYMKIKPANGYLPEVG